MKTRRKRKRSNNSAKQRYECFMLALIDLNPNYKLK